MPNIDLTGNDGKVYSVPEEQKAEAIATGAFQEAPTLQAPAAPPAPTTPIGAAIAQYPGAVSSDGIQPLIGKDDGKTYHVPMADFQKMSEEEQSAFRYPTPEEKAALEELQNNPVGPELATGAHQLLDTTKKALGIDQTVEALRRVSPQLVPQTPEEDKKEEEIIRTGQANYPGSATAAKVVGTVGSALALGEAGAGATKALGLTGFPAAAVQGGIFVAPDVSKHILDKDYAGAGSEALAGVLLNVALHGAGSLLTDLGKSVIVPESEAAILAAETAKSDLATVSQSLGLAPETGGKLLPILKEAKVVAEDLKGDASEVLKKVANLQKDDGAIKQAITDLDKIGDKNEVLKGLQNASKEIDSLRPAEATSAQLIKQEAERTALAVKEAEKNLKDLSGLPEASKGDAYVALQEARQTAKAAATKLAETPALSPAVKAMENVFKPYLSELKAASEKGTFQAAQDLKDFALQKASKGAVKGQISEIIGKAVSEAQDAAVQKLGTAHPDIVPGILNGLSKERSIQQAQKIFGDISAKEIAGQVPKGTLQKITEMWHGVPGLSLAAHLAGIKVAPVVGAVKGAQALGKFLEGHPGAEAYARILGKSARPATEMTLEAIQKQSINITGKARDLLQSLTPGAKALAVSQAANAINDFLPKRGVGKSDYQKVSQLRNAVGENLGDPDKLATKLQPVVDALRSEGLDKLADQYTQHQINMMKVLQVILPQDQSMKAAHPLTANADIKEISPAVKSKYNNALAIAADSTILLDKVKTNTISKLDVAIAAAINPNTLQAMREAVMAEAMKTKPNLSYQQSLSLGILMGENLNDSTEVVPALQSVYVPLPPIGGAGGKGPKSKGSAKAQEEMTNSYLTPSQKALQGEE